MFGAACRWCWFRAASLLLSAAFFSCDGPAQEPSSDDESDDIAVSVSALAEGRSVVVSFDEKAAGFALTVGDTRLTTGANTVPTDSLRQLFGVLCMASVQRAGATPSYPQAADGDGKVAFNGVCSQSGTERAQWSFAASNGSTRGALAVEYLSEAAAFARLCEGHLALRVAGAVQPLYLTSSGSGFDFSETKPSKPNEGGFLVLPVQNSASAAAFALFATDAFRDASNIFANVLNSCSDATLAAEYGASGQSMVQSIAANLSDAVMSMVEATEVARKYVAASAADKLASSPDLATGAIRGWRERRDSRLEIASVFGRIDEDLFEPIPRVELKRMQRSSDGAEYASTSKEIAEPGFAAGPSLGWIYSPDAPQPPGTLALITWRNESGAVLTTAGTSDVVGSALGPSASIRRIEGWVPASRSGYLTRVETVNGRTVLSFHNDGPFERPFPISTLRLDTKEEKKAERLLRDLQVNPCMSDVGGWPCMTTARTREDIASDLVAILHAESPGAYPSANKQEVLKTLGLQVSDIEVAARVIIETAEVFGRTIQVPEGDTRIPPRVVGTMRPQEPPPAEYLYARSFGHIGRGWTSNREEGSDVLDTLRLVASRTGLWLGRQTGESSASRIVRELKTWLGEHLGPSTLLTLRFNDAGTQITGIGFSLSSPVASKVSLSSAAEVSERCDMWMGEEGLACARLGAAATGPCLSSRVRVQDESKWTVIGGDVLFSVNYQFAKGDRVYVSCRDSEGHRQVVAAAELTIPVAVNPRVQVRLPPISKSTLEMLSEVLGADPNEPADAALSCAGVPRNVRLALEDELTEAVTGADGIESSFAYYIKLAKDAATKADAIGEDLVQKGLDMDIRAEQARENLEDLCGGVVDVGKLEKIACAQAQCDILKLLENASTGSVIGVDAKTASELTGVAQCLGVTPDSKPVWAAVGDQDLCIWQYYPGGSAILPPPLNCPNADACAKLERKPLVSDENSTCGSLFGIADLGQGESPPAGSVRAVRVDQHLNIAPTGITSSDPAKVTGQFPCRYLLALRAGPTSASAPSSGPISARVSRALVIGKYRPAWMTQPELQKIAESVGFQEDIFGMPTLTLNGKPWRRFGTKNGPIAVDKVDFDWPCTRPIQIDPAVHEDATATELCNGGASKSFFCGGHCGGGASFGDLTNRLRNGVIALKGLTGASFDNVTIRHLTTSSKHGLSIDEDMAYGGRDYANQEYYISQDRQRIAWWEADGSGMNGELGPYRYRALTSVRDLRSSPSDVILERKWGTPIPGRALIAYKGFGEDGWPTDLYSLWTPTKGDCADGFIGCGEMELLMSGRRAPIRAQKAFPKIKGIVCPRIDHENNWYWQHGCNNAPMTCQARCEDSWTDGKTCKVAGLGCGCEWDRYSLEELRDVLSGDGSYQGDSLALKTLSVDKGSSIYGEVEPYLCRDMPAAIGGVEVPYETALDALDLACGARGEGALSCPTLLSSQLQIRSVEDLGKVAARFSCAADTVEEVLDRMYVADVPQSVVRAIQTTGVVQTYPQFRGEYGERVAELGGELIELSAFSDNVVQYMRDVGALISQAKARAQAIGLDIERNDVDSVISGYEADRDDVDLQVAQIRSQQAISHAIAECAQALANATGGFVDWVSGKTATAMPGATAVCADTTFQVTSENSIQQLNNKKAAINDKIRVEIEKKIALGEALLEQEQTIMLTQLAIDIGQKFDQLHSALKGIQITQTKIHGTLTHLDIIRNKARREAAKVLMLTNDDLGRQYAVNAVMRARMNTLRTRYVKARDNAIRMGYIARRAVEQKLGVDMSAMSDPMTLVPGPSSWVDKLCSLSGIDYDRISGRTTTVSSDQNTTTVSTGGGKAAEYDYADEFIGDWVTQLENFVESYRLDYPFQDAKDVAVVSLRDDILHARDKNCPVEGWNELLFTSDQLMSDGEIGTASFKGWQPTCAGSSQASVQWIEGQTPYPDAGDSRRPLGSPTAFALSTTPTTTCPTPTSAVTSGSTGPASPPTSGLATWYIAENCPETFAGSGIPANCPSMAAAQGENRTATFAVTTGGSLRKLASGIGGKPTLELNGAMLTAPNYGTVLPAFTLSFVYRTPPGALARYFLRQVPTNAGANLMVGEVRALDNPYNYGPYASMVWCRDASLASPSCYTAPAHHGVSNIWSNEVAPVGLPADGSMLTVVSDDGSVSGQAAFRVYLNGQRIHSSHLPPLAMPLGGELLKAVLGTTPTQLAERLDYSRALSESEITTLHAYLATRYNLDLQGPFSWFDGDDMNLMRNGAQSPASGHLPRDWRVKELPTKSSLVFDRARGASFGVYGTGGTTPTGLTAFSGGSTQHYGLTFSGPSIVDTGTSVYVLSNDGPMGSTSPAPDLYRVNLPGARDHVVTFVARVDDAGEHGLFRIYVSDQVGGYVAPALGVLGGQIQLALNRYGVPTTTLRSPNGVIVPGLPFIASVRTSSATGLVDVFVNGQRVISTTSSANLGPYAIGGGLRGAIAQAMVHLRAMPDAELVALHRSLGTSYGVAVESSSPADPTAVTNVAGLLQSVSVTSGDYWLSWHQPLSQDPARWHIGAKSGRPTKTSSDTIYPEIASAPRGALRDPWLAGGESPWVRYYQKVSFDKGGLVDVLFEADATARTLAGIQLERIDPSATTSTRPKDFLPTRDTTTRVIADCEDTDGSEFQKYWTWKCEHTCGAGSEQDCIASGEVGRALEQCFYEVSFSLNISDIEKGEKLQGAGFARGNFNYRLENVAANFVGTGLKDCRDAASPSACYASSYAQYSLRHDGPFRIRNYEGELLFAPLFPGNIQQAKGLLAERYITNPIASSDESLLKNYWRTELVGRPIDGSFTLRLYGDDLRFSKLEDVQLVMHYGYWTRFR